MLHLSNPANQHNQFFVFSYFYVCRSIMSSFLLFIMIICILLLLKQVIEIYQFFFFFKDHGLDGYLYSFYYFFFLAGCVFITEHGLSLVSISGSCLLVQDGPQDLQASVVVAHGLQCAWASVLAAPMLQSAGSVVVAYTLSCPATFGTFPNQRSHPRPLHWQLDFQPTGPQGKSDILAYLLYPLISSNFLLYCFG